MNRLSNLVVLNRIKEFMSLNLKETQKATEYRISTIAVTKYQSIELNKEMEIKHIIASI